jgi:hypothetical protein
MFGRSQPVYFESPGRRRTHGRLPRWLWLLLAGTVAGAAAVIGVQERYLPPRLSAGESAQVRQALGQAEGERTQLRVDLAQARQRLQDTQASQQAQATELLRTQALAARLRDDLAAVVAALPPDPRSGAVAVRAGRFTLQGSQLSYDLVLTRDTQGGRPVAGALKLLVAGESDRGGATTVATKPIPLQGGSHEVLRGSLPLPPGFQPRQATVQVLDPAAGTSLGMRVLRVP